MASASPLPGTRRGRHRSARRPADGDHWPDQSRQPREQQIAEEHEALEDGATVTEGHTSAPDAGPARDIEGARLKQVLQGLAR